jgi:hypothetical protein
LTTHPAGLEAKSSTRAYPEALTKGAGARHVHVSTVTQRRYSAYKKNGACPKQDRG